MDWEQGARPGVTLQCAVRPSPKTLPALSTQEMSNQTDDSVSQGFGLIYAKARGGRGGFRSAVGVPLKQHVRPPSPSRGRLARMPLPRLQDLPLCTLARRVLKWPNRKPTVPLSVTPASALGGPGRGLSPGCSGPGRADAPLSVSLPSSRELSRF